VTIDLRAARACAWCGSPLDPDAPGRRLYCSVACRQDRGHYVEAEPGLRARLAELEAAASNYRGKVPTSSSTSCTTSGAPSPTRQRRRGRPDESGRPLPRRPPELGPRHVPSLLREGRPCRPPGRALDALAAAADVRAMRRDVRPGQGRPRPLLRQAVP
jgi:hypothetical protein